MRSRRPKKSLGVSSRRAKRKGGLGKMNFCLPTLSAVRRRAAGAGFCSSGHPPIGGLLKKGSHFVQQLRPKKNILLILPLSLQLQNKFVKMSSYES
ncbi:hypothetical protein COT63_01495 [Candidatus Shapirobacteria bacterium CG09_land_8_20_14_0_10_38_17]|uniref:Uncharacterized protein n=1 Tax=Candidatus Shapirobacteria bacterium CG09_land_8_20_14_0_10_38_17 TaxID=1974884 RepID=A0A2H0WR94_9BACT|nr:MAG: hypothetical protein COT63_01495 [Candidatus Shapirobacteria bacterium CG09_land_8_20_14_0_10_38_17]